MEVVIIENRYKIDYDIKQRCITNARFVQGDTDSATLEITLIDGGIIVDMTGEVVQFRFAKSDNTYVYQDSNTGVTIKDPTGGVVECVLKANTLAVAGVVACEIHREKDGKKLGVPKFSFTVDSSIESGVLSSNYISSIDSLLIDFQNTFDANEASRESTFISNELSRTTAESTRLISETARVTAETARSSAEVIRVSSETTRNNSESTRNANEAIRVPNETARIASETARSTAETARIASETARSTAETSRVSAEVNRGTNETSRQTAEANRVIQFNALSAGQQQSSEVIISRTSIVKGKTFSVLTDRLEAIEVDITNANYSDLLTQNANIFKLGTGKNASNADVDVSASVVAGNVNYTIEGNTIDIHAGGFTVDFVGKVAGSVVENPNMVKSVLDPSLLAPSNIGFTEISQAGIDLIKSLDATVKPVSGSIQGYIPQLLISFNVVADYERKYGTIPVTLTGVTATDLANKIAWLKANATSIICNWYGHGSCPSGNKAYIGLFQYHNPSGGSLGPIVNWIATNNSSSPTIITTNNSSSIPIQIIDDNGFVHLLSYTDMASTTSPTLLVMTGHGLVQWDMIENVTRGVISQVSAIGGTDRVITNSVPGQASGDIINKFHVSSKICETGTTTTNIKITNHGLSTGDLMYNITHNTTAIQKITVVDANTFTVVNAMTSIVVGDNLMIYKYFGQQTADGTTTTQLQLIAHGLSQWDIIENVTRGVRSDVILVGGTDRISTNSITGQTSGDVINKYHKVTGTKTATTGTNTTNLVITAHGLSTGDYIYNVTHGGTSKITVIDADTITCTTAIAGQVSGDILNLFHLLGQQTAEAGVIPSTINTDYISLSMTLKPRYVSVGEGLLQNIKNEVPYTPSTWAEWSKPSGVVGDITGLEWTANGSTFVNASINTALKTSTKYGLLYNVVSTSLTSTLSTDNAVTPYTVIPVIVGNNKIILTSNASISSNILYIHPYNTEPVGNKIKLKDIRIFELPVGSQIETDFNTLTADQLTIKYPFAGTGTQYANGIIQDGKYTINMLSKGKNLFDKSKATRGTVGSTGTFINDNASLYGYSDFIKITSGTTYFKPFGFNCCFYNKSKNFISVVNTNAVTAQSDGYIVFNFSWSLLDTIQLEEGTVATAYEPYIEDKLTMTLANPLQRVSATVADILDNTGKVARNISNWLTLDGSLGWIYQSQSIGFKKFVISGYFPSIMINQPYLCVKYNGILIANYQTVEGLYCGDNNAMLFAKVLNTDTGFADSYTPTQAEIKAYFYGWKMCHSDGVSPYQPNEINYTPSTWAEWTKGLGIVGDSTGLEFTSSGGSQIATLTTNAKPSTKYGLLYNVVSSNISGMLVAGGSSAFVASSVSKTIGNNKITFITSATITTNTFSFYIYTDSIAGEKIKIKDIRVFELPAGSQIETDFNTLTADQLAAKYLFYGLNPKNWKHVTDGLGQTATLPTASYTGYTPYKMLYQLANPTTEILNDEAGADPTGLLPLQGFAKGSIVLNSGNVNPTFKYTVAINYRATSMDNNSDILTLKKYVLNLDQYATATMLSLADKQARMAAISLLVTETTSDLKAKINEILNIWRS